MNDATYGPVGFRRFLHTHNPFYLISCFLIIYGLQSFAMGGGPHSGLLSTSIWMAGGIAAYILLMTLTCIAVVRLGKDLGGRSFDLFGRHYQLGCVVDQF